MTPNMLTKIFSALILRGLGAIGAVAITLSVSKLLNSEESSSFFLYMSLITIIPILLRWGADEAIIRTAAVAPLEELSKTFNTIKHFAHSRIFKNIIYVTLLSIVFVVLNHSLHIYEIGATELFLAIFTSTVISLFSYHARFLQGTGHSNLALLFLNVFTPSLFFIFFILLANIFPPNGFAAITLYSTISVLCLLASSIVIRKMIPRHKKNKHDHFQGDVKKLTSISNTLAVVIIAQQILIWATQLIVPAVYTPSEYEYFTVSIKIASSISLLMLVINFSLSPIYAKLYHQNEIVRLKKTINLSLVAVLLISLISLFLLFMFSQSILNFSKVEYNDSGKLFAILIISQIFFTISSFYSIVLSMAGLEKFLMKVQLSVNTTACFTFIYATNVFDLPTGCISLIFANAACSLILAIKVHKTFRLQVS